MSRPSHLLLLWFLVLGFGMWATGIMNSLLEGPVAASQAKAQSSKLQHSTKRAPELPWAKLSGRVIDSLGWPVADASIETAALVRDASGGDSAEQVVRSDAEGNFSLEVRGPWQHLLSAKAKGRGIGTAEALPGESSLLMLAADYPWQVLESQVPASQATADPRAEVPLSGQGELVDPDGNELPGGLVLVRETGETVRADEFGRFFRLPLPASSCTILAYDGKGRVGELQFNPTRREGTLPLGEITLDLGIDLAGILRDGENAPAQIAALELSRQGMRRQVFTDQFGQFVFPGLLPGEYELIAYPHRGNLGFRETITLDRDMDADWTLKASESLRIQVIDQAGAPQGNVHVVAEQEGMSSCYAQAAGDGYVVIAGLGAGPYAFEVRDQDLSQLEVLDYQADVAKLRVSASASPKER